MAEVLQQRAEINDDDFSLNYTVSPNFRTLDFHAHDDYEILYFLAGEVQYYIEDKSYYLMPGDILVIPPGKLHRPVMIDEFVTYERIVLMVAPDYAGRLLARAADNFFVQGGPSCRIPMSEKESGDLKQMMDSLLALRNNAVGLLERDSFCTLLLLRLHRLIEAAPAEEDAPRVRIQQVIHYINAHFTEPLLLEDIAERFYLSKYHLLRQFKAYTNSTVHNYILTKRVLLAKALLGQGIGPQEVSTACGFGSYAGFYQTFIRQTGKSPTNFIKEKE